MAVVLESSVHLQSAEIQDQSSHSDHLTYLFLSVLLFKSWGCFLDKQLVISPAVFKPGLVHIAVLNKFAFDGRLVAQKNKTGSHLFVSRTSD